MKRSDALSLLGLSVLALVASPFQVAQALSPTAVSAVAEGITVRIDSQNPGSGVLIKHQGNTYTVLTAAHVVATEDEYDLITPDEQRHPLAYNQVKKFPGVDLALVTFTSSNTYQVADLGDSNAVKSGASVYVSGFPVQTAAITDSIWTFSQGSVTANARRALADGYALVYSNNTLPGMSGGAVLDDQGKLIGIHGRADAEQRIQKTDTVYVKTGFNLGIPIHTFLTLVPKVNTDLEFATTARSPIPSILTADDWYLSAGNKYNKGEFQGAIADFSQAIKLKPDFTFAYYNRGVARDDLQDYQGAISDYTKAIQLKPDYANAYYNRGIDRLALDNKQGALADFTQTIQFAPDFASAYNNRGVVRSDLGDKQGAIADYTKAIQLNPDDAEAYYNRGSKRGELGDKAGAIADYTKAIQFKPNYVSAYNNRATYRQELGDEKGAIVDYNQVLQIKPDDARAYYNRGNVLYNLGDKQRALSDLTKAIQFKPDYANAYYNRGFVRKSLGHFQGAIADFKASARLSQQQGNQADYQDALRQIQRLSP